MILSGCSAVVRVAVKPFYEPAELSGGGEVVAGLPYRTDEEADEEKHRLNLFRPGTDGWPLLIFLHGGSLTDGDKDLRVGGYNIYGNLGRFYAARGIGVAIVNYRLQPEARWPDQVDDVAAALRWAHRHVHEYGGDGRVFLSGHSAGAWLAARLALDRDEMRSAGLEPEEVTGVILISGSAYDLVDQERWDSGRSQSWWAKRFDLETPGVDWREFASVIPKIEGDAPPVLLIHTTKEWPVVARQNRLLHQALAREGADSELFAVTTDSHRRMVLAMSRADKAISAKILDFVGQPGSSASIRSGGHP